MQLANTPFVKMGFAPRGFHSCLLFSHSIYLLFLHSIYLLSLQSRYLLSPHSMCLL